MAEEGHRRDMERLEDGLRADRRTAITDVRAEIAVVRNDLRWIKPITVAAVAVPVPMMTGINTSGD